MLSKNQCSSGYHIKYMAKWCVRHSNIIDQTELQTDSDYATPTKDI